MAKSSVVNASRQSVNDSAAAPFDSQTRAADEETKKKRVWPVVVYPFSHPKDTQHVKRLYDFVESLKGDEFAHPISVLNCQTLYRSRSADGFAKMRKRIESLSEVVEAWCTDTCAMWLRGLGEAFRKEQGSVNDVFWLIPGDFHYGAPGGPEALELMRHIPRSVYDGECQLCLGEIDVPPSSAKQLIDTYGTYGLLYNWFPAEAQGIRELTTKPRTEFFAIGREFLQTALIKERWYAYEQTLVILLQNMRGQRTVRDVKRVELGRIEDDPSSRSTLVSAMQQVERTERVLKQFWREINEARNPAGWVDEFRKLDAQSEQVRGAAMTILQQILGG